MPPTVKTFKDFHLIKEKINLYQQNIDKVKNYKEYDDLTEMYVTGENKLQSEYEAAKRIPTKDRKLIVLNYSIAKQAFQAPTMRHHYSKLASKVPPEVVHEERGEAGEAPVKKGDGGI